MFFSSGTATDSICPKGWRLPGDSGNGSFYELQKIYMRTGGVGDWTIDGHYDTGLMLSPLAFLRSGYYSYSDGNLNSHTSFGHYWSGRFYSIPNAYNLFFNSVYLFPQDGPSRGYGFPLRCLAR